MSDTDNPNDTYMPLNFGGAYTRATLRDAIEDWSVEAKFHFKVVATERAKVDYRCPETPRPEPRKLVRPNPDPRNPSAC